MNVLSLFDGMSCGQLALNRAGIAVEKYYASEIDKFAVKISKHHFPSTVHLGDITKWREWGIEWEGIDLIIGGSPCQGFSSSGKGLAFEDPRSKLLLTFIDIINHVKSFNPDVKFLLENVKMKPEHLEIVNELLGVKTLGINSSLVSAQNRFRYYWANWEFGEPEDKGVKLKDILDDEETTNPAAIRGRRLNKGAIVGRRLDDRGKRQDYNKSIPITQCLEVRAANTDKSNCLTTVAKDNVLTPLPVGRHEGAYENFLPFRYYSVKEMCRLQTVPEDFFDGLVSDSQARKMLGNGWTVDVISHILKGLKNG